MLLNDAPDDGSPFLSLTTAQAAERMGITPTAVLEAILAGRLPAVRHQEDWRLRTRDVDAYQVWVLTKREADTEQQRTDG